MVIAMRNGLMLALRRAANSIFMIAAIVERTAAQEQQPVHPVLIILKRTFMVMLFAAFALVVQVRFAGLFVLVNEIDMFAAVLIFMHDRRVAATGPVLVIVILVNGVFDADNMIAFTVSHGSHPSCSLRGINLARIIIVLKRHVIGKIVHDSCARIYPRSVIHNYSQGHLKIKLLFSALLRAPGVF